MEKNKDKPKLRFPGFTDPWEQRKLGDIVQITMGQSPDGSTYSETPSEHILVQGNADLKNGWVTPRVWTSQVTKKAEAGDLIMSVRAPAGEMGKTAYNAVIGRGVAAIKGNEFIFQNLVKMNLEGYWKRLSCGSTFESLNSDNIKNAEIMIPPLKEQLQIGTFFSNLDYLITLHQRKLNHLQDKKKGLLQKMFPKNGDYFPELRFPGFTDAWEQRKLSDVAKIVGGGTPSTSNPEYWDGDIDWYSPTEVGDNIYAKGSVKTITQLGLEKSSARILPPDKTVLFTSRAGIGDMAILLHPAATNQGFQSFVLEEGIDTYFIYSMGHLIKKYAEKNASGSTFLEISGRSLGNMPILVPLIDEQTQIGTFFKKLDILITLHQRKLNHLQEQKKALLQQMFI